MQRDIYFALKEGVSSVGDWSGRTAVFILYLLFFITYRERKKERLVRKCLFIAGFVCFLANHRGIKGINISCSVIGKL